MASPWDRLGKQGKVEEAASPWNNLFGSGIPTSSRRAFNTSTGNLKSSAPNLIGINPNIPWWSQLKPGTPPKIGVGDGQNFNAKLLAAKQKRADALKAKQKELSDAFLPFGDDYYGDMTDSYRDFVDDNFQSSYDDALRGIYQGFKSRGIMPQADLNAAIANLDAAKVNELTRMDEAASGYSQSKRDEVSKSQKTLGDQLSALVGGASSVADIDLQTDAINQFDIGGKVSKLRNPAAKEALNFFTDFDKVSANNLDGSNVMPSYGASQSASNFMNLGGGSTNRSLGINSPFQGSSIKNIT